MQQLLNGVFLGSIYGLFAIGLALVFGVLDRLNLAHSAVFTAGAFIGIELATRGGLPLWATMPVVRLARTSPAAPRTGSWRRAWCWSPRVGGFWAPCPSRTTSGSGAGTGEAQPQSR